MNVIHPMRGSCEKTRNYLDHYLSSELSVETNLEVTRHLETCEVCSCDLKARGRLRTCLQRAVRQEPVPLDLSAKVERRIRRRNSKFRIPIDLSIWAVAAATMLTLSLGTWQAIRWKNERTYKLQLAYIRSLSARLKGTLTVGLGDHVDCAVFGNFQKELPSLRVMAEWLGPEYSGLLPLVKQSVPGEYEIIRAHQCNREGRNFVHIVLWSGSKLVSLVTTKKRAGESFANEGLAPKMNSTDINIYQGGVEAYEVAGFEAHDYLVFVVSDLSGDRNLQLAASFAPQVDGFLGRLSG